MTLDLENPAWAFTLDLYARPGVSDACLTLQDQAEADIVALFMVIYAWSKLKIALTAAEIDGLHGNMKIWREATVLPLRHIRRALKPPQPGISQEIKEILRDQVKRAELLAEQIQIAMAEDWLKRHPSSGHYSDLMPILITLLTRSQGTLVPESCVQAITTIIQNTHEMTPS
ncbi:TIGR02444 family protein [Phaeovulum sp.]|uniref:TIGR02444 family protein n=1 Tax=Phaeovulum sp. TaxID=2934796 RepID=UPI0039E3907B